MRYLAAAFVAIAANAFAQMPQSITIAPVATPPPAPQVQPPKVAATIADAAWLQGYWVGEGMGGIAEDNWMPPSNGMMLGTFRLVKSDGSKGFYELLGIEESEESLRIVVKHFHPSWVGWEEKDRALQAFLVRKAKDEWQFSNMLIKRTGRDAFLIELNIQPKDGPPRKEVLRFKRQPL